MAIIDEIVAIESFVKARYPTSSTGKHSLPSTPTFDTFYIRFLGDTRVTETRYLVRATRQYQIAYAAESPENVIPKLDALSDELYQTEVISDGISVKSFSFPQPVELDSGGYLSTGILEVTVRKARDQKVFPLIRTVDVRQI